MSEPSSSPLSAPSEGRLRPLVSLLGVLRNGLHRVGYRQAESMCAELAARLRDRVPPELLEAAELRAIPRGGFIVLAMLAYHLGAERSRLEPGDDDRPLILVDDCALSGLRLRQTIRALPDRRPLVVAHLLSAPELRRAVESQEERVLACVAASDLGDLSGDLLDEAGRADWERRQRERLGDERYWIGLQEPVSFAWCEPDHPFWNPATGRFEDGWRFLPPHRCLKSRAHLLRQLPASAQGGEDGGWRSARSVVWGEFGDEVWLVREPDQEVFSLGGPAALAWKALTAGLSEEQAASALATKFDVSREVAVQDVAELRAELERSCLLETASSRRG